jgi:hypothetical protein
VPFQSRLVRQGRGKATAFEPLEDRRLFAVSVDPQGWTNVTPSADSRIIYVSSSQGSDTNNGLSPDSPVKTVAKGRSMLRNNSPDWLLLKRGDVWYEKFGGLSVSGRSAQEPILISAYGTGDRPLLNTRSDNAITTNVTPANHVAIIGVRFNSNTNDPNSPDFTNTSAGYGFYGVAPVNDILIEDCYFEHYSTNLLFQSTQGLEQNISVRRNVLVDSTGGRSQGVYVNGVQNILFEENLFDHNGWSEETGESASIYNHNLYMSAHNDGVVVRGNIFANASSHGLQARAGGVIEDNLFIKNPIGMVFGNGTSFTPGGVEGRVSNNVFIGSRDLDGSPRGYAIEVGNTKPGAGTVLEGNIFAHDDQRNFPAIKLSMGNPPSNLSEAVGLNDLTVTDNIVYDWYQGLSTDTAYVPGASGFKALNGLVIRDNDFQQTISSRLLLHGNPYDSTQEDFDDNHYWDDSPSSGWFSVGTATKSFDDWQNSLEPNANRTQRKYRDPDRDVETYNRSLGGAATTDAFLAAARQQSRQNWRPQLTADAVNDYVRDGFTVDSAVPTAGLEAPDVNALGGTTHAFIVHYADDNGIDPRTLGTGDVRVTGPNGYDVPATLVSVDRAGTTTRAAIYTITAPGGGWSDASAGLYTVSAQSNQVADLRGNYLKSGVIGTFWVRGDTQAPAAAAVALPVTVAGGTSQFITVTYSDNHAVDSSSITDGDLLVTGPNGFEQLASLVSVDAPGDGSPRVATYRVDAPDGTWDASDNGLYTVSLRPDEISDTSGNFTPGGPLTTFLTSISGDAPQTTRLSAASVTSAGAPTYTFTVAYDGDRPTAESAGSPDVLVAGPAGFAQVATVESVYTSGQMRFVRYSITTPQGAWDAGDNGRYSLSLLPPAAAQGVPGAPLPTTGTSLGSFTVNIARADRTPPTVVSAAFSATYDDKVILRFSEDVSASLSAADFELRQIVGRDSFAPARLRLTYDRRGNRAILTFDGLHDTGELRRGLYRLTIRAAGVTDGAGNQLDGDANGTAGGNYTLYFRKA